MENFVSRLKKAKHVMFITGAGVSVASGLPTYRGVGGIYTDKKSFIPPEILMSKTMWKIKPSWVWNHFHKIFKVLREAEPNVAHDSIVMMEAMVRVTVVTQNVDGLHRKAGSEEVIELHGSVDSLRCEKCGHTEVPDFNSIPKLPKCPVCSSVLRPPVVLFGEHLPRKAIEDFENALNDNPDIVIIVGSTGNFPYIIEAVRHARETGALTVVVDPILADTLAPYTDLWINETAEIALPRIAGAA